MSLYFSSFHVLLVFRKKIKLYSPDLEHSDFTISIFKFIPKNTAFDYFFKDSVSKFLYSIGCIVGTSVHPYSIYPQSVCSFYL